MSLMIPTTPFERVAARYIRHQCALGKQFRNSRWIVNRLAKFLHSRGSRDLDAHNLTPGSDEFIVIYVAPLLDCGDGRARGKNRQPRSWHEPSEECAPALD
jgi:hypothetical protein